MHLCGEHEITIKACFVWFRSEHGNTGEKLCTEASSVGAPPFAYDSALSRQAAVEEAQTLKVILKAYHLWRYLANIKDAAMDEEHQQRKKLSASLSRRSSSSFSLRSPSLNSLRLRRVFDLFDKNGDGVITVEEISQALFLLGLEAEHSELRSIITSFIRPGLDGLAYSDFEALHKSLNDTFFDCVDGHPGDEDDDHDDLVDAANLDDKEVIESDLTEAFKVFDQDGDGYISAMELQTVLSKLGLPEANQELRQIQLMISSFDLNHDGRVDFFEFKDMMLRSVLATASS
ncbi:hypothetical protein Cgig2_015555 [Carnegiea gigantea]|uniref:EF-hand domain-containing protein n=1 Tax=Carnegiea gigantea TaxID=171969 RepID=A0A9Q1K1G9_9CARY|nr:hypothetical protein Cgig2_015555 [Carnegiea gigantea]